MGLQDSEQDQALERYRSSDDEVMNMTLTMDGGLGLSHVLIKLATPGCF